MTSERSGPSGEQRTAAAPEHTGAEPDDRDATAGTTWSSDCGPDCGCLGDRGSQSARASRAAKRRAEPSPATGANDFPEPWSSMMAAMCGRGSAISSWCAPVADAGAESATVDSGTASPDPEE